MSAQALLAEATQQQAVQQDSGGKQAMPSFLSAPSLKLLFFGGKGGTGKTTSSAATALRLVQAMPDRQVLIMSTDPAHSLGDSLDQSVGPNIVRVRGVPNLSAVEIDPPSLLATFKRKYGKHLKQMAAGTVFSNQADIRDFLTFRLPGMEDLMIFAAVAEYLQRGIPHDPLPSTRCNLVVIDTAPTGHTLRLLTMPEKYAHWVTLFKRLFSKYYRASAGLQGLGLFSIPGQERGGRGVPQFLSKLIKQMEFVGKLLTDPARCEFVMVTIPEEMGVAETVRLARALDRQGIAADNVIVNRVRRADPDCPFCRSQAEGQTPYLKQIQEQFAPRRILQVPLFPEEIRGQEALMRYGQVLVGENDSVQPMPPQPAGPNRVSASGSIVPPSELAVEAGKRFLIFAGKGGVGKTSVSASTALRLARRYPEKRVLVVSTDPAHSLGDSLDLEVGDSLTAVPGRDNLTALELDAAALYEKFRADYAENINAAFEVWESREVGIMNLDRIKFDRGTLLEYVKSYPPGVEEVLVMERLLDFTEADRFDLYVLDPAPTGHMLKLLAFPELIKDWLRVTYRAILKYQQKRPVENLALLAQRMVRSTNAVKTMHAALTDPAQTELVAVTIAEAMGKLEMQRMLETVTAAGIPVARIVCNFLAPATDCAFCAAKRGQQLACVDEIADFASSVGCAVTGLRQFPQEVRGPDALDRMGAELYGDGAADAPPCPTHADHRRELAWQRPVLQAHPPRRPPPHRLNEHTRTRRPDKRAAASETWGGWFLERD